MMKTAEITIRVDSDVAEAYNSASEQDRRKMDLLLGFQLTDYLRSDKTLEQAMHELSEEARSRGLTPGILDSIEMLERLPEDVSLEDIMTELYFRQKADEGLRQLDVGDGIEHEEACRRLKKWLD